MGSKPMAHPTLPLRPRMMIALAIIFGFIPLALNLGEGGEMLQAHGHLGHRRSGPGGVRSPVLGPILYVLLTRSKSPGQVDKVPVRSAPVK